jgi:hypothetical protein
MMFRNLPIEIVWNIYDFVEDTPKNNYNKCSKEIVNICEFITEFNSSVIYDYRNYIVIINFDNTSLNCNIIYGETDLGFDDLNDVNNVSAIVLPLSKIILRKIKNLNYNVPINILDKPYIFPFNTNNKIKKTYYEVIIILLFMMLSLALYMYISI